MSTPPIFSVVVPVYNKETHIVRALNSVLSQTMQNFELVIICDPSSDNSNVEVQKYTDPRIQVFYRDEPGPGGYAARNLGIKEAKGEWIAFLDADDEWFPEHLEKMYKLSLKFSNTSILGCGWLSKSDSVSKPDKYYRNHAAMGCHLVDIASYLKKGLHGARPIHTSVACVKRSSPAVKSLFIINPEVKRGGDLYAWLKMICFHKQMAWSNHIGAIYYTDAMNMVTKSAPSTAYLMNSKSFEVLSKNLNHTEKTLLQKYFNRWLRNDWKSNIHRGCNNFNLGSKLFWKGDFFYALIMYTTTVWPQNIRRFFGGSGRKFK